MSSAIITPPSVSWAQQSTRLYLKFNVECEKPDIKFDSKSLSFKGTCAPDQKVHEVEIPLYSEIDPEKSKYDNKGRYIDVILEKAKPEEGFWPTLTSDQKKHHWLKVDFERWQGDDESADEFDDMNDMPMDFGNVDAKGDSSSAEEDDLPDLE